MASLFLRVSASTSKQSDSVARVLLPNLGVISDRRVHMCIASHQYDLTTTDEQFTSGKVYDSSLSQKG